MTPHTTTQPATAVLYLQGQRQPFRCREPDHHDMPCLCNVFAEYEPHRYRCTQCGTEYTGERRAAKGQ